MRILVAEGEQEYAEIIAESLRRERNEVTVAVSAQGVRRVAHEHPLDVALLGVALPDGSGLDLVRELREGLPGLGIVFVSEAGRQADVIAGFEAGADDYVTKPFHPGELVARVRAVGRRTASRPVEPAPLAPAPRSCGLELDEAHSCAYFNGADLHCTPLEFEVLKAMAAVPGEPLSHAFLNARIWKYPNLRDGSLLKGHISSLRRKLRAVGGSERMVRTVYGVGYCLATQ